MSFSWTPSVKGLKQIRVKKVKKGLNTLYLSLFSPNAGKKRTRKTPNTDIFQAVNSKKLIEGSDFNYETCLEKIVNLKIFLEGPNFKQTYKPFVLNWNLL